MTWEGSADGDQTGNQALSQAYLTSHTSVIFVNSCQTLFTASTKILTHSDLYSNHHICSLFLTVSLTKIYALSGQRPYLLSHDYIPNT